MSVNVTPEAIVAAARSYIGVPWRNMGRSRTGIDCVGLHLMIGHDLDHFDYDPGPYGRATSLRDMKVHFAEFCDRIAVSDRRSGDFPIFVDAGWTQPHAGVIAMDSKGRETLIHAYVKNRRVAEDRMTREWVERIAVVYRVRG